MMKKSERNRMLLENFILHITHTNEGDYDADEPFEITPNELYQMVEDYIEEDHVDGKGNPDDEEKGMWVGAELTVGGEYLNVLIGLNLEDGNSVEFCSQADVEYAKEHNVSAWVQGNVLVVKGEDEKVFDDNHRIITE